MALPFLYSDFSGGFNTLNSYDNLTDNEAQDLQNVQGTTAGAIVKRNGFSTFGAFGDPVMSLFAADALATPVMIASAGTGLFSVSSIGAVVSIAGGRTFGLRWEFVNAPLVAGQGPVYGMSGHVAPDTPIQWAGAGAAGPWTNATGGIAVPNGKYMAYFKNQVYVAGTSAVPVGMAAAPDPGSRLYWSAIADPTNWDPASLKGAGFMDFDPNDGQAISALGKVGPYLLVCKPRKMWLFIDPAGPTVRQLSHEIGCPAHRSIAEGAEGTYFLAGDRGVFVTNGAKITPISDKIQPTFDAVGPIRVNAAAAYFNAHYYLSVPLLGALNDTILDFDAKLNSWWKHAIGSNQMAFWQTGVAGPALGLSLFSAQPAPATVVAQAFVPGLRQDFGSNFQWFWKGPWQSPSFYRRRRFPTQYFRKRVRQLRFNGSGTVDLSVAKDLGNSYSLVRSNLFATAQRARVGGGLGVANEFSLEFSATSSTADVLVAYTVMLTDRRDSVT